MKLVVLGAGESGTGAARLAKSKGIDVYVSERGQIKTEFKSKLEERNIPFEEGGHDIETLLKADVVVKSPGIPDNVPVVRKLDSAGIPIISEIEFAVQFAKGQIIAVTGSNGKTTTCRLIHHLLTACKVTAHLAGNIGKSFATTIDEGLNDGIFVLELSSFQLDGIVDFRPHFAAILNITPDHLDRYDYDLSKYIDSKFRIIRNQLPDDMFFYNASDENIGAFMREKQLKPQLIPILEKEAIRKPLMVGGQEYDLSTTSLRGVHNRMNTFFAISIVHHFCQEKDLIQNGLNAFTNAAHRMETVTILDGVEYINDSKATNVDSVYYALDAMEKPIVWIVGGQDKGNDYSVLDALVRKKVKSIICMGIDNSKILNHFVDFGIPLTESADVEEIVKLAQTEATEGDVVLMSPACASFDLFRNYIDRGDRFRKAVLQLK